MKSAKVVHIQGMFHWYRICSSRVLFKCFCIRRNCHFRLLLGIFFGQNSPKCCQFCLKFWPVMTCKMMHQILYGSFWSIKKWLKLGQKAVFWLFWEFFLFMSSHTLWVTSKDFAKWGGGRGRGKLGLNYHLGSHQKVIWNSQT